MEELIKNQDDIIELHDRDSWLKMFVNIEHKILIHIQEYSESDCFFSEDDEEGEWNSAGISLNKENAIKFRDKLNKFIERI